MTGLVVDNFAGATDDTAKSLAASSPRMIFAAEEKGMTKMNKHTAADLKQMQSLPLDIKIEMTKRRIKEWYEAFDGNVYVSFSGGKDSTVLLHIARQMYPDIPAVFVDTGLEYPEIRNFVKSITDVTWLKPEMNFRKVIETYGYPLVSKEVSKQISAARRGAKNAILAFDGKDVAGNETEYRKRYRKWKFLYESNIPISEKCCEVMKKEPAKAYEKETGRKPILATMAVESALRVRSWLQNGCNAFDSARQISTPMSFWTEQDILLYLKTYAVQYCPIYGEIVDENGKLKTTGVSRTGCMFCMFGAQCEKEPNRFQRMNITHPKIYDYCMKPMADGGLGLAEVLDFIGVKH